MSKSARRSPVIIDTDPGVDDTCAILLALASPELEILAITTTFGNTEVENTHRNVLKIWHAVHKHIEKHPEDSRRFPIFAPDFKGDIPFLARGSDGPLGGDLYNAEEFHGRDGLSDISTRHPELSVPKDWHSPRLRQTDQSAIELSLGLIEQRPARSITYIALGPLTNLALMMRKNATLVKDRIGRIIAMGGALEAAGNVTAVAEFNFYADPFAVRELLHPHGPSLGLPLNRFMLLPLDVTTKHELRFPSYRKIVDPAFGTTDSPSQPGDKSPLVHFFSSFLEQTAEVMRRSGIDALELHDPVTVWCAICNPSVIDEGVDGPVLSTGWTARMRRFQVETTGDLTRGMLVVDRRQETEDHLYEKNRGQARAEKHRAAVVEVEPKAHREELLAGIQDVAVVTDTPGSDALVRLMVERIWGL